MSDFLLEIGTEEIPDWMIVPALADLRGKFQDAFGSFGGSALITDATPRRLVLLAKDLAHRAPDTESMVQGPYLSAGEKAAEGFARKQGVAVAQLAKTSDAKGERYIFHQLVKGQALAQALSEKLPGMIASIHFPKSMYWTGKGGVRFIRPIRWMVAVLDEQVIPFEIAGVQSGNLTRGHRILGSKQPVAVTAANYFDVLKENSVIVRAEERRERIERGLGPDVHHDADLLQTLVFLTEYPSTIRGNFDASYLELPKEILSTVMRHHQRYFSVLKDGGSLAPEFVAITNTDGDPDGLIRQGNERVLRARFNDARFFWQVDQQKKLIDRVPDLAKVTFQAKLGSYKDKADRVQKLAGELADKLGADANTVNRAALLCKCDLSTDMVKEFTELQGVVGGLYARAQGEGEAVATAIYDHYRPVNMDDAIPGTLEGQIVSIADRLDTLRESFRIGLIPTGTKDPFALRRAAQGTVKILFEARLDLELTPLIDYVPVLVPFMRERIEFYLRDVLGFAYDEVASVMVPPITTLADLADRAEAMRLVRPTEDFEPLAASFKRIKNILKQAEIKSMTPPNPDLLAPGPEKDLYHAWQQIATEAQKTACYGEKLSAIASLRPQVDLFFDKILVNDPNPAIRENRLALLYGLLTEFSTIADFSEIATKG
ncbi:MAG TPA: glycine--tRNA ligase subunit beta [Bryobacteraceae bacterium]|nr:glycine--tRNA ligase subunit beta [Bryobacteraceae bacterium]